MKWVVSLYIWTVGLLSIGILLIIGILISFVLPPRHVDKVIKTGCRICLRLMCVRVEVEGAETVDPDKTLLFMANHVSLFDVPVLEGYIPKFVRAVEADRQFKWPVYGWAVRRFGNIPISRESVHASIKSMSRVGDRLKSGLSMVIMPEGHRTLDGQMRPFKKLPFHLAKEADVEILPIGLSGLFHLKAKKSWHIRPTNVKIRFGSPVSRDIIRKLSVTELRDHVRERIAELVERP
ncbi:1-acyl-sn-glycerol-3-phosphate acyltransferase [bacterium]|nr:1-acyl-sn-glycerol-3-phosphate acyltransferase [bacterium]